MSTHKSSDCKLTAIKYFLHNNISQTDVCKSFKYLDIYTLEDLNHHLFIQNHT